jgi:hypothetical protein
VTGPSSKLANLLDRPTRRRAGVLRRALRREASRLRDRDHQVAILLLALVFGFTLAGMLARGDVAGADARAYWAGVRIWLGGGDPYHPTGPFLPYVYAPWMLPLFTPWALLPWDVAWFVWRGATILAVLWTIDWAYRRRPLATAVAVAILAFPIGANLDTGNINLILALMIWGAQFTRPRLAGLLWGLAAWMKWIPGLLLFVLRPRARGWGLVFLAASAALSVATLPLTLAQLQSLFGFGPRPVRLDYLVLLWALVPWLWRKDDPFAFLRRSAWRAWLGRSTAATARAIRFGVRHPRAAWRAVVVRAAAAFGLGPGAPAQAEAASSASSPSPGSPISRRRSSTRRRKNAPIA